MRTSVTLIAIGWREVLTKWLLFDVHYNYRFVFFTMWYPILNFMSLLYINISINNRSIEFIIEILFHNLLPVLLHEISGCERNLFSCNLYSLNPFRNGFLEGSAVPTFGNHSLVSLPWRFLVCSISIHYFSAFTVTDQWCLDMGTKHAWLHCYRWPISLKRKHISAHVMNRSDLSFWKCPPS